MRKVLRTGLFLVLGACFFAIVEPSGKSICESGRAVEVDAGPSWTNSGIACKPGDVLYIDAYGVVCHNSVERRDPDHWFGPQGADYTDRTAPMRDEPAFGLIAKIGRSGSLMFVGPRKRVIVRESGDLLFKVNDRPDPDDNLGLFLAVVTKE